MSHVLLLQIDGKLPNIALQRLSTHHRALGDTVELVKGLGYRQRALGSTSPNKVYASIIFSKHADRMEDIRAYYPQAIIGGTGTGDWQTLEDLGISTKEQDYSLYPNFQQSIGFSQRGCRLKCSFCVVPKKEGAIREEQSIHAIWRGEPHPKQIVLLDNDFFGQPDWEEKIREMQEGDFEVSFNQGINARFLTDETAAAIASVKYRDDNFKQKRIYTAWDNRKDEERLFRGLDLLAKHGVPRSAIMVYMLIGFWPNETHEDREHRAMKLHEWGAMPYPMPFHRTPELVGFQRWVLTHYFKQVSWKDYAVAHFHESNLQFSSLPEKYAVGKARQEVLTF